MRNTIKSAITEQGELDYVVKLPKNLHRRKSFEEYASWLKERNEAKSSFVRQVAEAFFDKFDVSAFPKAGQDLEVWENVIGTNLLRVMADDLFSEKDFLICKWIKPVIGINTQLTPETEIPVGTSKFGGYPDVPEGFVWPRCRYGKLGFLGQINFSEVRDSMATRVNKLPVDGLLLVFAFQDWDAGIEPGVVEKVGDEYVKVEGLTQVVFVRPGETLYRACSEAKVTRTTQVWPSCALEMFDSIDLPVAEDTGDTELMEHFDNHIGYFRDEIRKSSHWMMGYPVHGRTSDTSPGNDWRGLITLDSEKNLGWSWYDGQNLDIYIRDDSLNDRSFTHVYGHAS